MPAGDDAHQNWSFTISEDDNEEKIIHICVETFWRAKVGLSLFLYGIHRDYSLCVDVCNHPNILPQLLQKSGKT